MTERAPHTETPLEPYAFQAFMDEKKRLDADKLRATKAPLEPYAFQKFMDEQKELDTDDLRYTIKPIHHVIDKDFKGEEHLYCDKSQLCPLGKYRRPKKMMEAEQRGFATVQEMVEADKKAEEDAKKKQTDAQQKEIDELKALVRQLLADRKTT
jgi:hypothetical protein